MTIVSMQDAHNDSSSLPLKTWLDRQVIYVVDMNFNVLKDQFVHQSMLYEIICTCL